MSGKPFDPQTGVFRDNIRSTANDDLTELVESFKAHGWVAEFPALADENGVVLVGHRRLAAAKLTGIAPVIKVLTLGEGGEADAARLRLAIVSNVGGKPLTKQDRRRIAEHLYGEKEWTMQRIAEALNTTHKTISKDLEGFVPEVQTSRPKGGRPKVSSPERKKAAEVYDELKAAGVEPTVATMVKESGFSRIVVEPVIAAKKAVEEVAAAPPPEPPPEIVYQAVLASLSPSAREKLEAGRRAYAKQLSEQFDAAVSKACRDWSDQIGITMFTKRLDAIEAMLTWPRNAVMKKLEYNIIMRCLHPDTAHSRSDSERAESFRLFTKYKLKMVNNEEERIAARRELRSQMPKTLAELLARRKGARK